MYFLELIFDIGTHQGFLNEVEQLKNKKKRKVILAEQWRNFQYQSITASYECEVKHAEDEFNVCINSIVQDRVSINNHFYRLLLKRPEQEF